jgi:hypothetical protein
MEEDWMETRSNVGKAGKVVILLSVYTPISSPKCIQPLDLAECTTNQLTMAYADS